MFSGLIDYTVSSTDPNNYNKIYCNLTAPSTKYSIMTITCLTTNSNIVVLEKGDYIIMDGIKYEFNDAYTNMNLEGFIELLRDITIKEKQEETKKKSDKVILSVNGVNLYIDNTGRLCFTSERDFVINDASYNVKMMTGMYYMSLPLNSKNRRICLIFYIFVHQFFS